MLAVLYRKEIPVVLFISYCKFWCVDTILILFAYWYSLE